MYFISRPIKLLILSAPKPYCCYFFDFEIMISRKRQDRYKLEGSNLVVDEINTTALPSSVME